MSKRKSIDLSGRIKHEVAKGVVRGVFSQAGYRVITSGMEIVFREVALLNPKQFDNLALTKAFKCLPDYFIAENDMSAQWPVEVKYRTKLDADLIGDLQYQLSNFGPFTLVLVFGKAPQQAQDLSQYIRCCQLQPDNGGQALLHTQHSQIGWQNLAGMQPATLWNKMVPLQVNFPKTNVVQHAQTMIEDLVKALAA